MRRHVAALQTRRGLARETIGGSPEACDDRGTGVFHRLHAAFLHAAAVGGRQAEEVLEAHVARLRLRHGPRRTQQVDVISACRLHETQTLPPLPSEFPDEGGGNPRERVSAQSEQISILHEGCRLREGHYLACHRLLLVVITRTPIIPQRRAPLKAGEPTHRELHA